MDNTTTNTFDKTEVYKSEIEPLTRRLHAMCQEHSIPYACVAGYKDDGETESMFASGGSPKGITNNLIDAILMLMNAEGVEQGLMIHAMQTAIVVSRLIDEAEKENSARLN